MSATRSGGRRARADAIDECLRSPRADGDQRIHRRDLIERGSSHRRRDRRLLRGGNSERRDDRRGEQYEPDASVVTVMDMRAQRMRLVARVEVGRVQRAEASSTASLAASPARIRATRRYHHAVRSGVSMAVTMTDAVT
jgi:hypothetical protein